MTKKPHRHWLRSQPFLVDFFDKRKHTDHTQLIYLPKGKNMGQAKTLTDVDVRKILRHINTTKYALRNRCIFLMGLWSGMRVGEIANLKIGDVLNTDGTIKHEVRLKAAQTKGKRPRTVFLSSKLRDEIAYYLRYKCTDFVERPLFATRCKAGFTPNTLAQTLFWIFRNSGVDASSHSMRRSYATTMGAAGISVRVIQKALGHANLATTAVYVEASDDMLRKAVEVVHMELA
jgi:integrase/recombinase XerD